MAIGDPGTVAEGSTESRAEGATEGVGQKVPLMEWGGADETEERCSVVTHLKCVPKSLKILENKAGERERKKERENI